MNALLSILGALLLGNNNKPSPFEGRPEDPPDSVPIKIVIKKRRKSK